MATKARTGLHAGRAAAMGAALALLLGAGPGASAGTINASAYQPTPLAGELLSVSTAARHAPRALSVGLDLHFADSLLAFEGTDVFGRTYVEETVKTRMMAELLVGYTALDWLAVGLAVPLVVAGESTTLRFSGAEDASGFHLGELRLVAKGVFVRQPRFGLGLQVDATLPTASEESLAGNGFGAGPRLVLDVQAGPVAIALNLGAYFRGEESQVGYLSVGHEYLLGLGGEWAINDAWSLVGETYARTPLDEPFGDDNATQLEALGAVRWAILPSLAVSAGGGGGTPLFEGYGTSRFRFFADVRWTWLPPTDSDGDGLADGDDACPLLPEDRDGFEDQDGCPDPDNDGDGILDAEDRCPLDAEDRDGFEDDDGCPDGDDDGDGVPDDRDRCPGEPEDRDAFQDQDGCPDPDNDGDGIPDVDDACPREPETVNGYEDQDGCPDYPGVKADGDRIVLARKLAFDPRTHEPETASFEALRAMAAFILDHPTWKRVRFEVHVGERGKPEALREIARQRGQAVVRFLVTEGVSPGRLEVRAVGGNEPIADPNTAAGRAQNDRVEIIIVPASGPVMPVE